MEAAYRKCHRGARPSRVKLHGRNCREKQVRMDAPPVLCDMLETVDID